MGATPNTSAPAPWIYLFCTLGWTWLLMLPALLTDASWISFPLVIPTVLALLGPMILPAILIASGRWDSSLDPTVMSFFRRCFNPGSLALRWYFVIAGLAVLLAVTPVVLEPTTLSERGLFDIGPVFFLFIGFLGALEEPGWRGYAQEGLQRRMSIIASSLVIGVFWAAWHMPLFFIDGTYQASLGVGTAAFWSFHLAIVVGSPIYAWLYNRTGRVIFAALLYHGLTNVARELVVDVSNLAEVGVEAVLAIVVILSAGRWMSRPAN